MRREKSASITGWCEELMQEVFKHQSGYMLLSLWCEYIRLAKQCTVFDSLLSVAKVTPVPKESGGHRPLAILDVWRRTIDRWALLSDGMTEVKKLIPYNQLGIGTSDGCQIANRAARVYASNLDKKGITPALLSMDAQNAFGSISHEAVNAAIEKLERTCPSIAQAARKYTFENKPKYWIDTKEGTPRETCSIEGYTSGIPY